MIQNAGQPTANTVSTTQTTIDQFQLEPYNGPKARVAVSRFTDQTAKGRGGAYGPYGFQWYSPQIGNGMADMLSDALLQSNRFVVLDRQSLEDVLKEQDLAALGRVRPQTGAPLGQIEGAELLIKGSVTEFEPGSAGAHAGGLLGFFGLPGAVLGGVLGGVRQSHVAMIIQVVDTSTSRMLFSTTVEGKANDFDIGGALAGFGGGVVGAGGLSNWQKTPVEKAIRIAVQQAVKELASKTPQTYFRHGAGTGPVVSTSPVQPPPLPNGSAVAKPVTPIKGRPPKESAAPLLPSVVTVKVGAANLRDGPDANGKILTTVKAKSKLSVQAEDKGWYLVQTEDGKNGWISKSLTTE
jgi:curli biogenesis system outer membrane secretion channel CsgG